MVLRSRTTTSVALAENTGPAYAGTTHRRAGRGVEGGIPGGGRRRRATRARLPLPKAGATLAAQDELLSVCGGAAIGKRRQPPPGMIQWVAPNRCDPRSAAGSEDFCRQGRQRWKNRRREG